MTRTLIIALAVAFMLPVCGNALTTSQLVELKKAGIPEDTIVLMVQADYPDTTKVLELKREGFSNGSILSIIKTDMGHRPRGEAPRDGKLETSRENQVNDGSLVAEQKDSDSSSIAPTPVRGESRAMIFWFRLIRGAPTLQNSQEMDHVKISMKNSTRLTLEWDDAERLGLLGALRPKGFPSPFYWDLNANDTLKVGEDGGYKYTMTSHPNHKGQPDSDEKHYWVLKFDTVDAETIRRISKVSGPRANEK